jgi:Na+:H+ antiporter, NhaA family
MLHKQMTTPNKLLFLMALVATAVIGAYAYQVLPGYLAKPQAAAPAGAQAPRVRTDDFVRGNAAADTAKTIIEFGDIECPYCGQVDAQINTLLAAHPEARLVWKDCPLPNHPNAEAAAEAARCAGRQGKFWEYRDLLFAAAGQLNPEFYVPAAAGLNLDANTFVACLENGQERTRVQASFSECANAGVTDLPWFYLNGKISSGGNAITGLSAELNAK